MTSRRYQAFRVVGGIDAYSRQVEPGDHISVEDVMHAKADVAAREVLLQTQAEGAAGHVYSVSTHYSGCSHESTCSDERAQCNCVPSCRAPAGLAAHCAIDAE
jgi:hypothetical protein